MPSGTPGLRAFTGGLLMVITAISPSLLTCTRLLVTVIPPNCRKKGETYSSRARACDRSRVDRQPREPFAMKGCVAEGGLRRLGTAIVKMSVILPGETHSAVNLDSPVSHRAAGIARVDFRDGHGRARVRDILFEGPRCVIGRGP